MGFLLITIQQSGPVALAGETAGGVRVRLDFFVSFFIKKKRKRKPGKDNFSLSFNKMFILTIKLKHTICFPKLLFLLLTMLLVFGTTNAQLADLEEKKPVTIDGVEYGYIIKNEQTKTAKGEEYGRFEITLYATNKSGCTKLFADRISTFSSDAVNLLATYNCTNANGKRLTAKSGMVKARDFNVNVKMKEGDKEVTRLVKAGYMFRNGETLKTNIIVLVPLNERPVINCSLNALPELQ